MGAVLCCPLAIGACGVGCGCWLTALFVKRAQKSHLIQGHALFLEQLTANDWSRDIKAQLPIPTLKGHLSFTVNYRVSWSLAVIVLQPNFSLHNSASFLSPCRGWSQEHCLTNLLHANPHLRFPRKPTLQHIFKRKLFAFLSAYFSTGWNTERAVVNELWPYEWGNALQGRGATR